MGREMGEITHMTSICKKKRETNLKIKKRNKNAGNGGKKVPDVDLDDLPGDGTTGAHERVGLVCHHGLPVPREHVPE